MPSIPLAVLPDPDDDYALQAWVDGVADDVPLRLLLDTGTPRSALPQVETLASLSRSIAPGGRGVFGVPAEETLVTAGYLMAGDLVTRRLVVQLQPEGWRHPPLLGMDVLGAHRCDFHFDDPRLDLDGPDPPDAAWFPLPTDPYRAPTVEVHWDETTWTAIWDTGAGVTLVDRSWAESHPHIVVVSNRAGRGIDVTGAEASHPWGTLAPCRIGGTEFAEQTCAVVDFSVLNATLASPIEIIIGLPLIAQASWCMDFPGRRWAVSP